MALPPQTTSGAAAPTGPWRWAMLGGVAMIYYAFGLTMASMAPLVHTVSRDLGMDNAQMGAVLGAWALVYIFTSVPCGAFLDRIGPRRALLIATTIIAISQVMRGTAQGQFSLFLAVAIFGIGGPLVSSGAPKVISQWFSGADRGMAIGIYFTGNTLGVITALTLTNSVMVPFYDGDWRSVLFTYAAVTFTAGLVWYAMAGHPMSRAMEHHEASTRTGTSLDGFLALIRRPMVQIIIVMSVCILFFNHSMNNWLPEILRTRGMTAEEAGYWSAIPVMIGIAAALTIPRMATAERRFPILVCLIVSAGAATLFINFGDDTGVAVGLLLSGLARGTLSSIAVLTLMDSEGGRSGNVGQASGLYFSAGEVGGMLGPLTVGLVSSLTGSFTAPLLMLTVDTTILLLLTVAMWRIAKRG